MKLWRKKKRTNLTGLKSKHEVYLNPGSSILLVRSWVLSLWFNCFCALLLVLESYPREMLQCDLRSGKQIIPLIWLGLLGVLNRSVFLLPTKFWTAGSVRILLRNRTCSRCLVPGSHLGWGGVSSCTGRTCSSLSLSQAVKRDAKGWQQIRICDEQETSLPEQSEEGHIFIWRQE